MKVTLTAELMTFVKEKMRSGRYVDESDVMRDALRDDYESPTLESALLEGVRSPHRPYGKATPDRVRQAAWFGIQKPRLDRHFASAYKQCHPERQRLEKAMLVSR